MKAGRHIGVLGGSFNPVHIGHVLLADYLRQFHGFDEVWFMLSPLNPLKSNPEELIEDHHRLEMLRIAAESASGLAVCDIELSMPRPSYTINSLSELARIVPDAEFSLIIGSDNWNIFHNWKDYRKIIERFSPIVYPRPGYPLDRGTLPANVTAADAPTFDISSTFLRRAIADGHDMRLYLPAGVWDYITGHKLYLK